MFLQLTSVLNYFTCDLRYFLRKSVRYLLKDNKINLPCCPFTFLSVVLSLFPFSVPLYCVPHTVVLLSVADLVLLIMLCVLLFLIRRQFPSIHKKCCGSDSKQVGSVWAAGGLPLPLSPYPIDFLLCSSFFFLSSDIQFSSFHFPFVHFQVWKKLPFSTLFDSITYILCWLVPAHH